MKKMNHTFHSCQPLYTASHAVYPVYVQDLITESIGYNTPRQIISLPECRENRLAGTKEYATSQ